MPGWFEIFQTHILYLNDTEYMNPANVHLSAEEWTAAASPGYILTKNNVMAKAQSLLGHVCTQVRQAVAAGALQLPVPIHDPKISKGERYKELPWVMLDYPRLFAKHDIFAIRSLFWWGHGFTCCLHLSGESLQRLLPVLCGNIASLQQQQWWVYAGTDEWQHEIDAQWKPAPETDACTLQALAAKGFLKVGKTRPVSDWPLAEDFLMDCYAQLGRLLV